MVASYYLSGDRHEQFKRYLDLRAQGIAHEAALQKAFNLDDQQLGQELQHYFSKRAVPIKRITSEGLTLNSTLGTAVSEKDAWKVGATHVDLSVKGDELSLAVNGKPSKTLKVDGLSAATGTITFRVRDTACAIDNVILRNVE